MLESRRLLSASLYVSTDGPADISLPSAGFDSEGISTATVVVNEFIYSLEDSPTPQAYGSRIADLANVFVVNTNVDSVDVAPGDGVAEDAVGNTSLRAAVMEANALDGSDTIRLPSGNYHLTLGGAESESTNDLDISSEISIATIGGGLTTIDADGIGRVIHVAAGGTLTLDGIEITGGNIGGSGGGVFNDGGAVKLIDVTVRGNTASTGGGIASTGELNIENSTVSGNTGGGIHNAAAAELAITRSTIADNTATSGAGIDNQGAARINNTIVAGNTGTVENSDVVGDFTSSGFNLIGKAGGGVTGFNSDDFTGAIGSPVDPRLSSLADNGGTTMTHALLRDSVAIDGGAAVVDRSGNGITATIVGDVVAGEGLLGAGADFPGGVDNTSDDFLSVDLDRLPANKIPTTAITVAAWVRITQTDFRHEIFASQNARSDFITHVELLPDGTVRFVLRDNVDVDIINFVGGSVPFDTWFHFSATYDQASNQVDVYVDGISIFSGTAIQNLPIGGDWGLGGTIGSTTNNARPFTGQMDEFYLFTRALSGAEIATLATIPATPTGIPQITGDLSIYYSFDDLITRATDQRGAPRLLDGDGLAGPRIDIGAFERFDYSREISASGPDFELLNQLIFVNPTTAYATLGTPGASDGRVMRYDYNLATGTFLNAVEVFDVDGIGDDIPVPIGIGYHDGDLWISRFSGWPAPRDARLTRLQDTDDDGIFDQHTDFITGMTLALPGETSHTINQIEIQNNSLYVGIGTRTNDGSPIDELEYHGTIVFIPDLNNPIVTDLSDATYRQGDFLNTAATDGRPHLFSSGYRNPYGLRFDSLGQLWVSDNGADAGTDDNGDPFGPTPDLIYKNVQAGDRGKFPPPGSPGGSSHTIEPLAELDFNTAPGGFDFFAYGPDAGAALIGMTSGNNGHTAAFLESDGTGFDLDFFDVGSTVIDVVPDNLGRMLVFDRNGVVYKLTSDAVIVAGLSVTTDGDEDGPVDIVYTVTLSESNDTGTAITFDLDDLLTGTATSGTDYTAIAADAQISVAAGASSGSLSVPVIDDVDLENTETLIAQVSNPSNASVTIATATATAKIADDDGFAALNTFVRVAPLGSLISESTGNSGILNHSADQEIYSIFLEPGETLAAELLPDAGVIGTIEIVELSLTASSPAAGQLAVLAPAVIPTEGNYTVRVTADASTGFNLDLFRNTALESVVSDTADGNELAINNSFVQLGSGRFAVQGISNVSGGGPLQFSQTNDPSLFVDISDTGTPVNLFSGGTGVVITTVGNAILPAGNVSISSNGVVMAGSGGFVPSTNDALPTNSFNSALVPYWDSFLSFAGNVYWQELQINGVNAFVVQWDSRLHDVSGGTGTFQVQVFETGPVLARYAYEDVDLGLASTGFGASATIGYQESSSSAVQFSMNTATLANGDVLDLTAVATSEEDEYEVDLTGKAGELIDVLLAGHDGVSFAGELLELLDTDGSTVLATASTEPVQAGTTASNFDLGILDFTVPDDGIYTIRVTSTGVPGSYSVVVMDPLTFDSEPNDLITDPLRSLDITQNALGFLGGGDVADLYTLTLAQNEQAVVTTETPFDHSSKQPLNDLDPELEVIHPDGSTVVASDQNSAADGRNALLSFVAPVAGEYTIRVIATSGDGEYLVTQGATANVSSTDVNGIGNLNRSGIRELTFNFDHPVTVSSVTSLNLFNHTNGQSIDLSGATLSGNGTDAVTWILSSVVLPDGNYTAELPAAATTPNLAQTHTFQFNKLSGDVNGNGVVSFSDYTAVQASFGASSDPWGPGDANGNGVVSFSDYTAIQSNFGGMVDNLEFDTGTARDGGDVRHVMTGNKLTLGTSTSAKPDAQSSASADGSGTTNSGEESGVFVGDLVIGSNVGATVTAQVPTSAVLNGWIDFNDDGDWDDGGEHVFVDEPIRDGLNTDLSISVPEGLTPGSVSARFRLSESTGYSYFGLAPSGEVEDQTLDITAPVPVIALGSRRQWALMTSPQPNTSLTNTEDSQVPGRYFQFTAINQPRAVQLKLRDVATPHADSSEPRLRQILHSLKRNVTHRIQLDTESEDAEDQSIATRPGNWFRSAFRRFLMQSRRES